MATATPGLWYEYPESTTWLELPPLEDLQSRGDGNFVGTGQYDIFGSVNFMRRLRI